MAILINRIRVSENCGIIRHPLHNEYELFNEIVNLTCFNSWFSYNILYICVPCGSSAYTWLSLFTTLTKQTAFYLNNTLYNGNVLLLLLVKCDKNLWNVTNGYINIDTFMQEYPNSKNTILHIEYHLIHHFIFVAKYSRIYFYNILYMDHFSLLIYRNKCGSTSSC